MVRIILKNGDILKYPDATTTFTSSRDYYVSIGDENDKTYAVFNFNNIVGWDYEE